jgi:hypothetical protein
MPQAVGAQCAAWRLRIAGGPAHGSHALVVPVERDGEAFVLRTSPGGHRGAPVRCERLVGAFLT